jgi:phosphoribosylglycinamide formyltransferase-1
VATLDLGVLVSGSGTNLQAILDAVEKSTLDARVRLVVSNRSDTKALERAERAGVPTRCLPHSEHPSRDSFDEALVGVLREAGAEWIVLAGFMRLLTPRFLRAFEGRIVNIHPSLLPAFPGTRAQEQALHYGVKVAGCTVHFVDEGVDTGPVIGQRAVPVLDDDTVESLTLRILEQEHTLLVDVLRQISEDRVSILPAGGAGQRPRVAVSR